MGLLSIRVVPPILAAALLLAGNSSASGSRWPKVLPLDKAYVISDPQHAVVKTKILGEAGQPLYLFVCRTWADESVPGVIYTDDLDCRLLEASWGEIEANLLLETPKVAAWYSRGRMLAEQLAGDCANYPEYGRVRHFRLRGMRLTLEFDDVVFEHESVGARPRMKSYTLRLRVDPDTAALRDIAESSGYLDPHRTNPDDPRSCSEVRKGNEWGKE